MEKKNKKQKKKLNHLFRNIKLVPNTGANKNSNSSSRSPTKSISNCCIICEQT